MLTLLIISALLVLGYLLWAKHRFDINSIPDIYIKLKNVMPNYRWTFTVFCLLPAFTLLPAWLENTNESVQFLCFLAIVLSGIYGIAADPLIKESRDNKIFISILISILFLSSMGMIPYHLYLFYLTVLLLVYYKCREREDLYYWLGFSAISVLYLTNFICILFK